MNTQRPCLRVFVGLIAILLCLREEGGPGRGEKWGNSGAVKTLTMLIPFAVTGRLLAGPPDNCKVASKISITMIITVRKLDIG